MLAPLDKPKLGPSRLTDWLKSQSPLSQRLQKMHDDLLERTDVVDRIACALYDPVEDTLKTFINSTRHGDPIAGYEFKLSDSRSLYELAGTGRFRVLDDIPQVIQANTEHSRWLLDQGYRSSFTVPMYGNGALIGFIFFDSVKPAAFTPIIQRDLVLYCTLLNMTIASELSAVRAVLASAKVARDFANLRDFETGAHLERMARYSRLIAKGVAPHFGLSDEFVENVYLFAPLHDIGKIGIPDKVLLKPGKFSPEEREVMESHVDKGCAILETIIGDFDLGQMPDAGIMRNIVSYHHEFLDGTGYPRGLKGDAIPLEARIVTVADMFDALNSQRPYKNGWTTEATIAELQRMAEAGKLDPHCVQALVDHADEIDQIARNYQDELVLDVAS
jgi:HD-GYP domain-containing protein (c-di-GMP phosphodiesterase class II)